MNKKAIALLGGIFILIVGTLGFIIYSRSKPKTPVVTNQEGSTTNEESSNGNMSEEPATPSLPETRAVKLSDDIVMSPILTYAKNGISYFDKSGILYQTDMQILNGMVLLSNKKSLSIEQKAGITKILWPSSGNYYLAQQYANSSARWSLFDPNRGAYVEIPKQVRSIDWMPNGSQIVYIWVDDNGTSTMSIASPDTSGHRKIIDMFQVDNLVDVAPDGSKVAFYRNQNQDPTKNTINVVSIDGKTVQTVVKDGYNRGVNWSPDSRKFLFNKKDPATQRFVLWVADTVTGEIKSLNIISSVDKAVWSSDSQSIYLGEPIRGNADIGLTEDNLAVINVNDGSKESIESGAPVDMQDLFLSGDGTVLFFRNAQDNYLYYMLLGQ